MEEVEGWARIASFIVDAKPAVVILGVQDERETVVDLRDQFIGFCGDQSKRLKARLTR